MIADCFAKSGLLSGYLEVHKHFPPSVFNVGVHLRDANLPKVDSSYITDVLSIENLSDAPGSPVRVNESHLDDRRRMLHQYMAAGQGFRKFYFALGSSAIVDSENADEDGEENVTITEGVRKLFKLGAAKNLPRGAPGRLSTAYGSLDSARDQWSAALKAEQAALRACAEKQQRQQAKQAAELREKPLLDFLVQHEYMKQGERLTKKVLTTFLQSNKDVHESSRISLSSPRGVMVDCLLDRIARGQL